MTSLANTSFKKSNNLLVFILSSVSITLGLFFIDEGYYNLKWMMNAGNWIAFGVYVFIIFSGQILFSELLFKKHQGWGKLIGSMVLGPLLLFSIIWCLIELVMLF